MTHPVQNSIPLSPPEPPNYRAPMTDEFLLALRHRNAERLKVAISLLGPKWLLYSHRSDLRRIP